MREGVRSRAKTMNNSGMCVWSSLHFSLTFSPLLFALVNRAKLGVKVDLRVTRCLDSNVPRTHTCFYFNGYLFDLFRVALFPQAKLRNFLFSRALLWLFVFDSGMITQKSKTGSIFHWKNLKSLSCLLSHLNVKESPGTPKCQLFHHGLCVFSIKLYFNCQVLSYLLSQRD